MSSSNRINYLTFFVNGKMIIEHDAQPEWTLLWYLRTKCRLTGSKLGCGEGGCGACTVLISHYDPTSQKIVHRAINGCLASICCVDGCHITTVEGINGIQSDSLHPIQERIAELYGSQCGFCTPGIVMSLYGTLNNIENPTMQDIEDSFDGNLCRCTGYRPILDAAKTFACDKKPKVNQPSDCSNSRDENINTIISTTENKLLQYVDIKCPALEFPPSLLHHKTQSIHIKGITFFTIRNEHCFADESKSVEWYRPVTLVELVSLKNQYPTAKIVSGNTMVQIDRKFKNKNYPILIGVSHIQELNTMEKLENGMIIGAGITIAKLKEYLKLWLKTLSTHQISTCHALLNQLNSFGSEQIRNVATIGGNIIHGSSISSLNPILQACNAKLKLIKHSTNEQCEIALRNFFVRNNNVDMERDEILLSVYIPFTEEYEYLQSYKQSKRRKFDTPIVSCGFQVKLEHQADGFVPEFKWKIQSACLSFGGIASSIVMMKKTQDYLKDKPWCKQTMKDALKCLLDELTLDESTSGGQAAYRRTLVTSFFFKFYLYVKEQLQKTYPDTVADEISSNELSAIKTAYLHATGEAKYTCDIPTPSDGLYSALVLSTRPYARIVSIDKTKAEEVPGFKAFISHLDVPGCRMTGDVVNDEEVFPSSIVYCVGTVIGLVVADNEMDAQHASKLIDIKYECLKPLIVTIDQAIEQQSYLGPELSLKFGNLEQGFQESEHTLTGEFYIGGQEHFYLETNCCLAIPHERGELELFVSTQNATGVQEKVAAALGIPSNKIVVHVKRIGGGFGGKDSIRHIRLCIAISIAAMKLKRPVRLTLDRNVDMLISGQNHPFKSLYKVGFTSSGLLKALDIVLYSNGGWSQDYSVPIMERALLHCDNVYNFKNLKCYGRVCKTNIQSMTAFRGFGIPQANLICEIVVEHVSSYLKVEPVELRQINLYQENDSTHFHQILINWHVPKMWNELIKSSEYYQRLGEVKRFNRENHYRKRGIAMNPTKLGLGFTRKHMYQAAALIHIYRDGTVLLTHGGTEMGQGLHVKTIQVASEILQIDINLIRISETATDKIPNASSTAGSVSSDLYGNATKLACQQINERLKSLREEFPEYNWFELISRAYYRRINLSAEGFYTTPHVEDVDFANNFASYPYFTTGCACSEVEIDTLTGDFHILRTDILMDFGLSMNPNIDVGQIEGAFMQGVGMVTMEEIIWGDEQHKWLESGSLFTQGPGTYKIPSFNDVPINFRVSLFKNAPNPFAIFSSKGVGEPALTLSTTVFFAIKKAIESYRHDNGLTKYFALNSPATCEKIRMACADNFTKDVVGEETYENFQPNGSY
ncbi:unnamed protein product [Rotaria socialis]|uniref:Xanthine dehydrogenase n=1 Tax=Rotaria socialis TaxID=392032 RepID=A0A821PK85_9BILA|nr:unnamed protein product [Rotaria socialis]